jgi:hypothetical protein
MNIAKLVPPGTEILAGLEMGGIPVATALSRPSVIIIGPIRVLKVYSKYFGGPMNTILRRCLLNWDTPTLRLNSGNKKVCCGGKVKWKALHKGRDRRFAR